MAYFTIAEDRCLNYNYKKANCRRCRDICPRQCWDDNGNSIPERCDACGLCQAVCPVDAIGVEGQPAAAWTEMLESSAAVRQLSCQKYGAGPWSCLGFLNARDLVALAWARTKQTPEDVFLYTRHCAGCREPVAGFLAQEVAKARQFLAFWPGGTIREDGAAPQSYRESKRMDRRGFFGALFSTGVETAQNVLWPEKGAQPLEKAKWRSRTLRDRQEIGVLPEQTVFPVLSVADSCITCGLCAKICPVEAITTQETAESLSLLHNPLLCTGCGLCVEHCPENSIAMKLSGAVRTQKLIEKEFPRCNECGEIFKPAGRQLTCFECLLKGRHSVFGPDADINPDV